MTAKRSLEQRVLAETREAVTGPSERDRAAAAFYADNAEFLGDVVAQDGGYEDVVRAFRAWARERGEAGWADLASYAASAALLAARLDAPAPRFPDVEAKRGDRRMARMFTLVGVLRSGRPHSFSGLTPDEAEDALRREFGFGDSAIERIRSGD